ncbi:MAG: hypothetical protein Q9212_000131 [Teloschistes hypoglaucus]
MKDKLRSAERRMAERTAERQASPPGASFPRAFSYSAPKSEQSLSTELYVTTKARFAKVESRKIIQESERQLSDRKGTGVILPGDQDIALQERKTSAGPEWFYLPRTKLTPELKRNLQILKMRSIWDPKRHYKNDSRKDLVPQYSQFGTILEGPTEFYSSRISKRDRKQSFVDEVLAVEDHTQLFRSKYDGVQVSKRSGRQGFYRSLKRKRSKR